MRHLLIGGTGTLGTALTERLLDCGQEVVCLSRGELAQKQYGKRFPRAQRILGDVRDKDALRPLIKDVDTVFLLAAIKHVDLAEENPAEAIKTNILGAMNVAELVLEAKSVQYVVYSNTDKAVLPITTYGYTKAVAQNLLLAQNSKSFTRFSAFNWGNIIASRGSVVPLFVEALLAKRLVPITHPEMSRFWLTIEQAADFMLASYQTAPSDRALIPPVKAAKVVDVVEAVARILGVKDYVLGETGLRGVEKLYEVLESTHAGCLRSDTCLQYSKDELETLLSGVVLRLAHAA